MAMRTRGFTQMQRVFESAKSVEPAVRAAAEVAAMQGEDFAYRRAVGISKILAASLTHTVDTTGLGQVVVSLYSTLTGYEEFRPGSTRPEHATFAHRAEFGFEGPDRLGRENYSPPRPYLIPAMEFMSEQLMRYLERIVTQVLRGTL